MGFPDGSAGKESACNEGDLVSVPGLGRSPGEGKDYPLQCSGLENAMNWIVQGVAKSRTRLSGFNFTSLSLGSSLLLCPLATLPSLHPLCQVLQGHPLLPSLISRHPLGAFCKPRALQPPSRRQMLPCMMVMLQGLARVDKSWSRAPDKASLFYLRAR